MNYEKRYLDFFMIIFITMLKLKSILIFTKFSYYLTVYVCGHATNE